MPAPATTTWDLKPHSLAKHEILKRYMQAWVPIFGQSGFSELVYIDGFAGPGRYSNGEDGSPVIAVKAALERQNQIDSMTFLFVEKDRDRADMLDEVLGDLPIPGNFTIHVARGRTFAEAVTRFLDERTLGGRQLPPTFAFIDPFGWRDVPFELVCRILSLPRCEVLITFMYVAINRFLGLPNQACNFNTLFGTDEWDAINTMIEPQERNRTAHDLYLAQLKNRAGAQYVRSFEMSNDRNVTDYYLFYATNHLLGLKKMKEAMWKVDESGEFRFSDATDRNQMVLFRAEPQSEVLRTQIIERFRDRETTIREI
ncbi:MAG: three-Cys-motif partner protein TcmP, partial [Chloroflexi bacterium]|nr:three-Cys-motif partner protein TcmP [Chloroflexota bacterium]